MKPIPIPGCRHDVLGHNLKAIGLLRVLATCADAEHRDTEAMARHWLDSAVDWRSYPEKAWEIRHCLTDADLQHGRVRSLFANEKSVEGRNPVATLEKPLTQEGKPDKVNAKAKTDTYVPDRCPSNERQARGVRDNDMLPACKLPDETGQDMEAPQTTPSLDPMELGLSARYGPSWRERMQGLLERLGPFRLAYLEAMLRVADWRARRGEDEKAKKSG